MTDGKAKLWFVHKAIVSGCC